MNTLRNIILTGTLLLATASYGQETFNVENVTTQAYMGSSFSTFTPGSTSYLNDAGFNRLRSEALAQGFRNDQPAVVETVFNSRRRGPAQLSLTTDGSEVLGGTIQLSKGSDTLHFTNLVPGRTYSYKVSKGRRTIASGDIVTTGQLRMIKLDNGWNIRDMGGWTGFGGNKVRYEWIYRGGSLIADTYCISDEEIDELERLGIRAHLDLRAEKGLGAWPNDRKANAFASMRTPLKDGVYQQICTDWALYDPLVNSAVIGDIAFIIRELRNGNPVYFDCRTGADRTGAVGMAILGLLGCDGYIAGNGGNQIAMDYELTSLAMDEENTIRYNRGELDVTSSRLYSNRFANGISFSGYKFFRIMYGLTDDLDKSAAAHGISLSGLQDRLYYYFNRYFLDNSIESAGRVHINPGDLDWFINFMLGIDSWKGPSWETVSIQADTLDAVIAAADAKEYLK